MSTSKYVTIILSGVIASSNDFTIYAENKLTTPIKSGVTRTELTNSLTPYVVLVPSATTKMVIYDNVEKCSIVLDIDENNLCQSCDINFKSYSTNQVGRLSADVLTASCINNLTDYRINWYGPNSSTNIIWTTGKGSSFPYNSVQPITGNTSLYVPEGIYKPVIDKIKISGVTFSQTGDTTMGNIPIPAELNCLPSVDVVVSAFTCDNGVTSDVPQYKHKVYFQSRGNGQLPSSMYGTFRLSATTKAFAFLFEAFDVPDEFRITYYGQNYGFTPILLEWWKVGKTITTTNFSFKNNPNQINQLPYHWNSLYSPLQKIINFKNFNLTNNDYLIIEVIPNKTNIETDWLTYFSCVDWDEPTDCAVCNTPYKIIKSGITRTISNSTCNPSYRWEFPISGCTSELNALKPGYLGITDYFGFNFYISFGKLHFGDIIPDYKFCNLANTNDDGYTTPKCEVTTTGNKIIISKTNASTTSANIKIECENLIDFNHYYNSYLIRKNQYSPTQTNNLIYSGNTYYKSLILYIPIVPTPNTQCGDSTTKKPLYIHDTSIATTGYTNGFYFLNLNINTIPNVISNTQPFINICTAYECNYKLSQFLDNVNNTVTEPPFTYTYKLGQKFKTPFDGNGSQGMVFSLTSIGGNNFYGARNSMGYIGGLSDLRNYTVAFSGVNNTLIPSLTAITCNNLTKNDYKYNFTLVTYPNNDTDYSLYYTPIVNGTPICPIGSVPGCDIKILEYSGGTFTYVDSNYVI